MSYDPDPRRRARRRGTRRRGGLPKSIIKKYGISKRAWQVFRGGRTHDPKRGGARADHKPYGVGRRGGVYWSGARKPRYDPARFGRVRRYGRRIGGKAETFINRYGTWLGALLGGIAGVYRGYQHLASYATDPLKSYTERIVGADGRQPEVMMAFLPTPELGWNQLDYLKYKFLGLDQAGAYSSSAWVVPFWASLITWIICKLPLPIPKFARIKKPLGKLATGALAISTIGALALPGSPVTNSTTSRDVFPTTTRTELSYYR